MTSGAPESLKPFTNKQSAKSEADVTAADGEAEKSDVMNMSIRGLAATPCRPTRHTRKLLNRIKAAHSAGKAKKVRQLIRVYLNSYDARLTAVKLAFRRLKPHRRSASVDFNAVAEKLNPWTGTTEEVRISLRRKASNPENYRITMDFGLENRALQYLLLLLLRVIAELQPNQCATKGGTHVAIKKVVDALKEGLIWVVEVDIVDFFPTLNGEKIVEIIPLPKKVTERVLISRYLHLVPGNLISLLIPDGEFYLNETLSAAQFGIPQGSATSSILAEWLLADAIKALPHGTAVCYADNLLLLAKSENDVASMVSALRSALKSHPAGPLGIKIKKFPAGQPIEFLGHSVAMQKGTIKIQPSSVNRWEFESGLGQGINNLKTTPAAVRDRLRTELRRRVRGWTAAFKLCHGIETERAYWLKKIDQAISSAAKASKSKLSASEFS